MHRAAGAAVDRPAGRAELVEEPLAREVQRRDSARRVRTVLRKRAIPPMVGAYERPLSLTTITRRR